MIKTIFVLKNFFYNYITETETNKKFDNFWEALQAAEAYNRTHLFAHYFPTKQYLLINKEGRKILLNEEQVALHYAREERKKAPFDYRKDSLCYGIYCHWDESKERFFMLMSPCGDLEIYFPDSGTKSKVVEANLLNLRGWRNLKECFAISEGEKISVLGGDDYWAEKIPMLTQTFGVIPEVEEDE